MTVAGNRDYYRELWTNRRALLAVALGTGAGLAVNTYFSGIFAPYLLDEFGWTKAQFALLPLVSLLSLLALPIAGRCVDLFGVRRTVLPGAIIMPLTWLMLSYQTGSIGYFLAATGLAVIFGVLTTAVVYSRVIAENFTHARGLALAIVMSGPALLGAIGVPLLTNYIGDHGWRDGYQMLALVSGLIGGLAWLLIPASRKASPDAPKEPRAKRSLSDYREVLGTPTFWIIFGALVLCNIANILHGSQMKLMLMDRGLQAETAAFMISIYAIGVLVGRFCCGFALDRWPAEIVAACAMVLPAVGFLILGSGPTMVELVAVSIALVGLSQGAEGDLGAYLVLKFFRLEVYGTVYGLMITSTAISTAIGAIVLSRSLDLTGSFSFYLLFCGLAVLIGSSLFLLLRMRWLAPRAQPA